MVHTTAFMTGPLAWTFNIHASCPLHYRVISSSFSALSSQLFRSVIRAHSTLLGACYLIIRPVCLSLSPHPLSKKRSTLDTCTRCGFVERLVAAWFTLNSVRTCSSIWPLYNMCVNAKLGTTQRLSRHVPRPVFLRVFYLYHCSHYTPETRQRKGCWTRVVQGKKT
ncbi:hypothetical protein ARMGADRAFT_179727 [Armillaria gallica]|uniref:Uncharacterized protein n=1 Tax=Armillaria gallica TaxID=47427 RepID=A0A2H3DEF2_ARMGA|nr:hypothetical protein ARMGADRAFT_179727 [Armillaria gallica]